MISTGLPRLVRVRIKDRSNKAKNTSKTFLVWITLVPLEKKPSRFTVFSEAETKVFRREAKLNLIRS